MNEPAQRALEGEVQARFGEAIQLCQEEAPGCQRSQFRSQRGKPTAIRSALTKWITLASLGRNSRANVVLPAPFGPAMTMQNGFFVALAIYESSVV